MKSSGLILALTIWASSSFAQACTDLFFSEYIEGSSNNKVLEIYNPGAASADLSQYTLQLYSNGGTNPGNTLILSGTLAPGATYVISNGGASQAILSIADTTSQVTNFNGDDAIVLLHGTDTLDIIGIVGNDPGTQWTVGSGATLNFTLIRKASVNEGTTDWNLSSTQWDVLPIDDITNLGSHTMDPCGPITDTIVRFVPATLSAAEAAGTVNVTAALNTAIQSSAGVEVHLLSGDTSQIGGFSTQNLNFSIGSSQASFSINIVNDTLAEGADTLRFVMRNVSGNLVMGADSVFTLVILPSDLPSPVLPISVITTTQADGTADSVGVRCTVSGTVYGVNLRPAGLQFFIHDGTGGMGVFENSRNLGYTVNEGDSVRVSGVVAFFNGLIQMSTLDTIELLGQASLRQPTVVTGLSEATDCELVTVRNVTLPTPSQWGAGSPSGFTVDITDGTNTIALRIDADVDLFGTTAPSCPCDITGIGSQFDNAAPYTEGYQLLPRYSADIRPLSSMRNESLKAARIYPNPSSGTLQIEVPSVPEYVVISDMAGRELIHIASPSTSSISINISELKSGYYQLLAIAGSENFRAGFIRK